jgi:hypothetical protein
MEHLVTKRASCFPQKTKQPAVIILREDMSEVDIQLLAHELAFKIYWDLFG